MIVVNNEEFKRYRDKLLPAIVTRRNDPNYLFREFVKQNEKMSLSRITSCLVAQSRGTDHA